LAGLALGVYLWWQQRRSKARAATLWRAQLAMSYDDAMTVRNLLAAAGDEIEADQLEALRHQTDTAAGALGQLSSTAPDEASRARTTEAEQALRSYMLAIEAEQLLHGDAAASEDARADANVARRSRATALDEALARLDQLIRPSANPAPPA
jgi:hypothetical protein